MIFGYDPDDRGPRKINLIELKTISADLDELIREALAQTTWDTLTAEQKNQCIQLYKTNSQMRHAYANPKELAYNRGCGARSETKELLHKILGKLSDLDHAIKIAES